MSLNVDELWIGDKVKLLSSGEVGTFEGKVSPSIAKIQLSGYLINVPVNDLEMYKETPLTVDEILQSKEIKPTSQKIINVPSELDLHIEVLEPTLKNQMAEQILNFQIQKAKEYIEAAISKRKYKITIIHGKGTGVLRAEIKHLLKSYDKILFTHEVHNGGAIDVLFKY